MEGSRFVLLEADLKVCFEGLTERLSFVSMACLLSSVFRIVHLENPSDNFSGDPWIWISSKLDAEVFVEESLTAMDGCSLGLLEANIFVDFLSRRESMLKVDDLLVGRGSMLSK